MRSFATMICLSLLVTTAMAQPTPPAQTPPPAAATAVVAAAPQTGPGADELLQRGRDDYRAGRYTEAAQELRAASAAFLSPEQKQKYIDTGKLATLPQVEQSLVYLALTYAKLGKDAEARDAVMRLANAERISPTFATLPLPSETAEFPSVAAKVAPGVTLPQNPQLAYGGAAATPTATIAQATTPPSTPATTTAQATPLATTPTTSAPAVPAATTASAATASAVPPTAVVGAPSVASTTTTVVNTAQTVPAPALSAADRAAMMKQMDEQVAAARAEIDREAAARIAQAQKDADARVAAEKAAADRAAQQKIEADRAAAERAAAEQIAADRAAIQRDTDAKIAAEHAAAERAAQQRIAAAPAVEPAPVAPPAPAAPVISEKQTRDRIAAAQAESDQQRTWLSNLRQAESLAESGSLADANQIYVSVANAPNAPREILAAAGAGLYRTGDFRDAVAAFRRLAGFARGEEDLRYYNAVSLFEVGRFDEAKQELACALPFLQVTQDVERYRAKIEGMPAQQAMK